MQAGITVYGCGPDEAAAFGEVAPRHGVVPTVTEAAVSGANADLALGNRWISVGHKTPVNSPMLLALRRAGVRYISTRSIGYDHIDLNYAEDVGICVGNVAYSPDSVADYTLMLMLMTVRHATSVIRRTDRHDYRLHDVRGKELRDLTVGVVGTGRIGTAVMDRLRGFGCRTLAYDTRPSTAAHPVALDELLERSDFVTLHASLNADTHHILDRSGVDRSQAFVQYAGVAVAVAVVAGDLEQCLRDRQRGAQFVGGVGGEPLLFGDLRFEPGQHRVDAVGQFAELIAAAR
jgi:D-specific alpha-keto acid dehydrogenase